MICLLPFLSYYNILAPYTPICKFIEGRASDLEKPRVIRRRFPYRPTHQTPRQALPPTSSISSSSSIRFLLHHAVRTVTPSAQKRRVACLTFSRSIDSAIKGIDGIWEGRAPSRPFHMAAMERNPPAVFRGSGFHGLPDPLQPGGGCSVPPFAAQPRHERPHPPISKITTDSPFDGQNDRIVSHPPIKNKWKSFL